MKMAQYHSTRMTIVIPSFNFERRNDDCHLKLAIASFTRPNSNDFANNNSDSFAIHCNEDNSHNELIGIHAEIDDLGNGLNNEEEVDNSPEIS